MNALQQEYHDALSGMQSRSILVIGDMVADILFRHVRELGVTLILVTHDPQLAARCERRLTIDRGRLS